MTIGKSLQAAAGNAGETPYVLSFVYNTVTSNYAALKISIKDGSVLDAHDTSANRNFYPYSAVWVPSQAKFIGMTNSGTSSGSVHSYDPDTYQWTLLNSATSGGFSAVFQLQRNENIAGGYSKSGVGDIGALLVASGNYSTSSLPVFSTNSQNFWPVVSNNDSYLWTLTGNYDLRKNTTTSTTLTKATTYRSTSSDSLTFGSLLIGQDSNLYVTSYDKIGKYPLTGGNTPATATLSVGYQSGYGYSGYYGTSTQYGYIIVGTTTGGVYSISESSFTKVSQLSSSTTGLTGVRQVLYDMDSDTVFLFESSGKICAITVSSTGSLSLKWKFTVPAGYSTFAGAFVKSNAIDWLPI